MKAIEISLPVPVSADNAFERFTSEFSHWWPKEYTWSQEKLEWIGIDPRLGGRCTERSADDFTIDFGRVVAVNKPNSIIFAWCIDPDRVPIPDIEKASVVEIEFASSSPESTMVTLKHSRFDRHGEKGNEYRANMASEYGWPYILKQFAASFEIE